VQVGRRLGSSGHRQLPLWPLSLRSAGRLDSRGAGTRAIDSRTCSRLAVTSVCPCVGPCGRPLGAGGVCGPVVVWTSCFIAGFRSRMGGPVRTGCGSASGVAQCQTEPLVDCRPRSAESPCGNPPARTSARQPRGTRLNPQALITLRVPQEFARRGCPGLRGWGISAAGWGRRARRHHLQAIELAPPSPTQTSRRPNPATAHSQCRGRPSPRTDGSASRGEAEWCRRCWG
jgi:hypothetical protein